MAIDLYLNETHIGADLDDDGEDERGYRLGADQRIAIADSIFNFDGTVADLPQLKRAVLKYSKREHGRCSGKMWADDRNGKSHPIGYVFTKLRPYEDDRSKKYRHTVWISFEQRINGVFVPFSLDDPMRYEGC